MALDQVLAHLVENLNAQMNGGDEGKQGDTEDINGTSTKSALNSLLMDKQLVECRLEKDKRDFRTWQKIEFAKLIRQRKHILFGECDGAVVTAKAKEDAWREIQHELEEMGADSFKGKPWMRLRDHDWQYIRRHAMNRFENGKVSTGRLSELDEIVVEIVQGDKTATINNNVAQENDAFGAQLCSLLAATSDSTQNGPLFALNEEELNMSSSPPTQSPEHSISMPSHTPQPPSTHTPPTAQNKRNIDNALRNALASLSCAFPQTEGTNTPNPQSSNTSMSLHRPSSSTNQEPPTKRQRSAAHCDDTSLDSLHRHKLELEIEHMLNEELRRQERHSLEMERLQLSVAVMRKCLDTPGGTNCDRLEELVSRFHS